MPNALKRHGLQPVGFRPCKAQPPQAEAHATTRCIESTKSVRFAGPKNIQIEDICSQRIMP